MSTTSSKHLLFVLACCLVVVMNGLSQGSDWVEKENYIFVSALERNATNEPPETWHTVVYKIDIGSGRIIQKKTIAEKGAATGCISLPSGEIVIVVEEGIAANGSVVGKHIRHEYTLDKSALNIRKKASTPGRIDEPQLSYVEGLDRSQWRNFKRTKGIVLLGRSPTTNRIYLFSNYITDNKLKDLELKIQDEQSSQDLESIPLGVGDRDLTSLRHTVFLKERFLICLFRGRGYLGYYGAGYVMIIDLNSKQVNYVTIGSNPAMGIAY